MTAEEAETLHELRETCEDHLNTLARVVESGGVHDDALLQRAIEVAESLVAAIGGDEAVAAAAAAETESRGYAPPPRIPRSGSRAAPRTTRARKAGSGNGETWQTCWVGSTWTPGARNRRRGPRRAAEHRGGRGGDGCRGDRREPGRGGAAAGGSGAAAGAGGAADATATRQPD